MDKKWHDGWLNKREFHKIFIRHILGDIGFCLDNKRSLAAAQLLLSAVDTAAGLTRPLEQEDTVKSDFIAWADEFLALKGHDYQLSGSDVYAVRCGFLHGYTPFASMVSEGKAVLTVFAGELAPPSGHQRNADLAYRVVARVGLGLRPRTEAHDEAHKS